MAIVGTAYVEVRALTDKINGDISKSLSSQNKAFESAGRQYNAALQRGLREGGIDLSPDVDSSGFKRATEEIGEAAERTSDRVSDSGKKIGNEFSGAGTRARTGFLNGFGEGQISAVMKRVFYQILFAIPAVGALVGALSSLASGFFAVGSAIAPAASALAVLPGLAAAAVTGIAALVVSFGGIGAAYKAGTTAATGGGKAISKATSAAADAVEAANDRIARSQRSLRDAIESANDSVANAAQSVTNAENNLASALAKSKSAQEAVNSARKEAVRTLQDLQWSAEGASISEGKAALALERAQEKLREVAELKNVDGPSQRIYKEAELNYRQAVLDLEQSKRANTDAADASAEAAQKGVENSDAVVSAKADELSAIDEVKAAQTELADAQIKQSRAQRDAVESIADAQKEVADAQKALAKAMKSSGDAAGGASGGVNKFAEAMAKLSPEAQSFVRYLISLQDTFRAVRNEAGKDLFPALESSLRTIVGNGFLDLLASGLRTAGGAVGEVAKQFAGLTGNTFFTGNLQTVFASNSVVIQNFGSALNSIINLLVAVAAAAAPVTEAFSAWVATKADEWLGRAQGDMDGLSGAIERGAGVVKQLSRIFGLLWDAIKTVGGAAQESGQGLLDSFEEALVSLNDLLTEPGKHEEMKRYFAEVADNVRAIGDLFNDLAEEFIKLGDNPAIASIAEQLGRVAPLIGTLLNNSLETVGPIMADVVDELVQIFDVLAGGGEGGSGLQVYLTWIQRFAEGFNALVHTPGLGGLIKWLLQMFATYKAFSLLANVFNITKIFKGIGGAITSAKAFADGFRGITSAATKAAGKAAAVGEAFSGGVSKIKGFASAIGNGVKAMGSFIATNARLIASQVRGAAVWAAQTAKIVAQRVATLAASVAQRAVAIASQAWAVAQRVLNAALNANPIGLIITAITLLVAAIVYAWNNSETFRDIVMGVWDAVLGAVQAVASWFTDTLVPWLQGAWDSIVSAVQTAWDFVWSIIKGVADGIVNWFKNWTLLGIIITNWDTIVSAIQTAWNFVWNIIVTVGSAIGNFFSTLWNGIVTVVTTYINIVRTVVTTVFNAVWSFIQTVWNGILAAIQFVWNLIYSTVSTAINNVYNTVQTVFNAVSGFISGVWNGIKTTATNVWNGIVGAVSGIIDGFKTTVVNIFTSIRDTIAGIWDGLGGIIRGAVEGLADIVRGPINGLINMVNGIIDNINSISFTIPDWVPGIGGNKFGIDIPKIPKLAAGGTIAATPGGMFANIAEAGRDERVTPLLSNGMSPAENSIVNALQSMAAQQTTGGSITIVLNAPAETNLPELARLVSREIQFLGV